MEKNEAISAIEYLIKYKTETDKIEAKSAKDGFPKKCYDTISSFSNKYGGIIIFGISEENDFSLEGVYDLNALQKQITDLCTDSMEPAIRPEILPIKYKGKSILAVKINEISQNKKPCYYKLRGVKNGSYTRIGDRDDIMTDYELYSLQSYKCHIFEDIRPSKRSTLEDLNMIALRKYIEQTKRNKPNFSKNSFNKCLKLCGIIDKTHEEVFPTLAGNLIFGKYPQSFYPQLFIACVAVPGNILGDIGTLGERFIDNKRVEGTIEEMLNETMNFLMRNMKTSVIINSNGERIDRTEYPLEALREAVANSLIHRDYSIQTENAYISVNIYNDRIEIINPGTLYGTNKIEKLGSATTMESRNPNIVRILEEKGSAIENRHSGIPTMKREMRKYGLPDPEFYEERDSFKVVFRNNKQVSGQQNEPSRQQKGPSGQQNEPSGQQNEASGQQKGPSGQQKGPSGQQTNPSGQQNEPSGQQNKTVSEYQDMILEYCKEAKTVKEIKEYLNIKSRQYISTNIIKPLISNGKLDYTNKNSANARNQKYITIDKK